MAYLYARLAAHVIKRRCAEETLRQSEEKYRVLFDSIDEGLTVTELVGDVNWLKVNLDPTSRDVFSYEPQIVNRHLLLK